MTRNFRYILCFVFSLPLLWCGVAKAEECLDEDKKINELRANIRRIALEMSSTEVTNADLYSDSPSSELSSDSKTEIKGVIDFVLEYEKPNWQWNNSLYLEYAQTRLKPVGKPSTTDEDDDQVLFSSDYNYKFYKDFFDGGDFGPFISAAYETEFTRNNDAPKMQAVRAMAGLKLFNGKRIKEFYVAGVSEYDFTYSNDEVSKSAYEVGFRFRKPVSQQIRYELEGYYRDYLSFSQFVATDLEYELNVTARMRVKIHKRLSLSPYMRYFQGKARGVSESGSNFLIGVAFAYSDCFDLL